MQGKPNRLKAIFISLALLAIGQVIWWAYLLINQREELFRSVSTSPSTTLMAESQLHHFTTMILSESAFFITVWALAMWSAFRFTREQAGLRQAHSDFFSAITHELKTPLSNIQLSLDSLERPQLPEGMKQKYIQRGQAAVARLLREIEGVLILTNSDVQAHDARDIPLQGLVEQSIGAVQGIQSSPAKITVAIDRSIMVHAPPEETRLIVQSLIDNAFKYHLSGQPARVEISAGLRAISRVGNHEHVELKIRDFGLGFHRNEIQNAFQPFWRSSAATQAAKPGTGLGLALAMRLARRTQIQLNLESDGPGQGATASLVFVRGKK